MENEINIDQLNKMIEGLETPRMKCLKKAQKEHLECMSAAGDDENAKSKCIKKLQDALASCPPN